VAPEYAVNIERATRMAARRLRGIRVRALLLALFGAAVLVGGFAIFGVLGNHRDWLLRHGRTAQGEALSASLGKRFDPNVVVAFTTATGQQVTATVHLGEWTRYPVGGSVEVHYDPAHPSDATLGEASLPPVAWVALTMLFIGPVVLVYGVHGLRFARRGRRALCERPELALAYKVWSRYGRSRSVTITVFHQGFAGSRGPVLGVIHPWGARGRLLRGTEPGHSAPVAAFCDPNGRRPFLLIVDPDSWLVTGGRVSGEGTAPRPDTRDVRLELERDG
jgi:hypothetical protein